MTNQSPKMFLANRLSFEDGSSASEVLLPCFNSKGDQLYFITEIIEDDGASIPTFDFSCDLDHLQRLFQVCPINDIFYLIPRSLGNTEMIEIFRLNRLAKASFTQNEEVYFSYRFDSFDGKRFYYDPEATGEQIEQLKYRTIIDFEGMYVD
jgi:hypothetical protein